MENKKTTKISLSTFLLILAIIVIVVMGLFIYKLNNDKTAEIQKSTELQSQLNSNTTNSNNSSTNSSESTNTQVKKENYDSYVGTWYNSTTQNEITIKSVTNNSITFTWFLYRLTGIDDDTTINFSNGEAIFYFKGYDDKNFDSINTEDEKYIRKATIKLDEAGVNVNVEDVKSLDNNYLVLDEPSLVYITKGLYSHPEKLEKEINELNTNSENQSSNSTNSYEIGTIKNIYDVISDSDTKLVKAQKIAKEVMTAVNNKDWYYLAKMVGTDADYFIKYGIYNYTINVDNYQEINGEYIFDETYETTSPVNESLGNILIIKFEDGGKIVIDPNCTGI